jgi:hypothetical protein
VSERTRERPDPGRPIRESWPGCGPGCPGASARRSGRSQPPARGRHARTDRRDEFVPGFVDQRVYVGLVALLHGPAEPALHLGPHFLAALAEFRDQRSQSSLPAVVVLLQHRRWKRRIRSRATTIESWCRLRTGTRGGTRSEKGRERMGFSSPEGRGRVPPPPRGRRRIPRPSSRRRGRTPSPRRSGPGGTRPRAPSRRAWETAAVNPSRPTAGRPDAHPGGLRREDEAFPDPEPAVGTSRSATARRETENRALPLYTSKESLKGNE